MLQQLISGLEAGSWYALIGMAVVVIMKATDVPNFSMAEMGLVAAYVSWGLLDKMDHSGVRAFKVGIVPFTISSKIPKTEQVALYVAEARTMGVPVLAPEINASGWDFGIEDIDGKPNIRFGLGAIKNVGQAAVQLIIEERDRNGKFKNLNEFARRVDLRAVGKRALECLIKVGAMDMFGNRAAMLASLDRIVSISSNHFRAAESGP